jgi:hypothetical protein
VHSSALRPAGVPEVAFIGTAVITVSTFPARPGVCVSALLPADRCCCEERTESHKVSADHVIRSGRRPELAENQMLKPFF